MHEVRRTRLFIQANKNMIAGAVLGRIGMFVMVHGMHFALLQALASNPKGRMTHPTERSKTTAIL
jgi:hypothetical protein